LVWRLALATRRRRHTLRRGRRSHANIIADLPRQYGKPEEYRFYKGDPNNDIQPVSKEALIGAIKKCHQTLFTALWTAATCRRFESADVSAHSRLAAKQVEPRNT